MDDQHQRTVSSLVRVITKLETRVMALESAAKNVVDARYKSDSWEELSNSIAQLAGLIEKK